MHLSVTVRLPRLQSVQGDTKQQKAHPGPFTEDQELGKERFLGGDKLPGGRAGSVPYMSTLDPYARRGKLFGWSVHAHVMR
jgi:hypothetical protein